MSEQGAGTRLRCLVVWLGATVVLGALAWLLLPDLAAAHRAATAEAVTGQPFERLLEWSCAGVAAVGAAWVWSVTTLVTLEAARGGGRRPVRGVPAPLRRLVLAACGAALTGGLAAPALATPGEPHQDHAGAVSASLVQGLPLPDRATGALPGGGRTSRPPAPSTPLVVVRAGDTLWDLAGESPAWHRIYELNRDVIGPDPDLIRPGQRLRLPRP